MAADIVPASQRSAMMRAVKQHGTSPELAVRGILRDLGVAYRVHNRDLPGSPDMANRRRHWAVFVNGCFWHGHRNCSKTKGGRGSRVPKKNSEFWRKKLEDNRRRDARKCRELRARGFRVLIVWECQLRESDVLRERLGRLAP